MRKFWSLIAMAGALLGAVSCTPVGGAYRGVNGAPGAGPGFVSGGGSAAPVVTTGSPGSASSGARATSAELRQLREQRAGIGGEQVINSGGRRSSSGGGASLGGYDGDGAYDSNLPPINIEYPYAIPVPGRKGWVFNYYTNRPVDVRGVESGRLIYDERDPENRNPDGTLKPVAEMPNKFRVP